MLAREFAVGQSVIYHKTMGPAKYKRFDATIVKINKSFVWIKLEGIDAPTRVAPDSLSLKKNQ